MKIEIKEATLKELNQIQKLSLELFEIEKEKHDPTLRLEWSFEKDGTDYFKKSILNEKNCNFIAIADKKVVGYLTGSIIKLEKYRNVGKVAELENLIISKDYRRNKIGEKLVSKFIEWSKTKKAKRGRVHAYANNNSGIKFYKSNNFKEVITLLEVEIE